MKWFSVDLAKLSGGSGLRAAGILVVAHLVPGLVAWGLWTFGLLSVFDDARWIPISLATAFALASCLWLFLAFGIWGTLRTFGRSYGENYQQTFSPLLGFGLGWLRWLMQIVLVAVVFLPTFMTWANVRWWHLAGTDELDALPDRAAAIPVLPDWERTEVEASETGFPEFMTSTMEGPEPSGFVEQTFTVPDSFTFPDLKRWLQRPEWSEPDAFGAVRIERCDTESVYCDAQRVPPAGAEPEYFIRAQLREPSSADDATELEIRLTYHQYVPPDWDVSEETVERAHTIPVPAEWLLIDARAASTPDGETFIQRFGVPTSFDRSSLEAWMKGPEWTNPADGEPFGPIEVKSCRETGAAESTSYLCSALVVGTERVPGTPSTGPVESLLVSLDEEHTVRVRLERNG